MKKMTALLAIIFTCLLTASVNGNGPPAQPTARSAPTEAARPTTRHVVVTVEIDRPTTSTTTEAELMIYRPQRSAIRPRLISVHGVCGYDRFGDPRQ